MTINVTMPAGLVTISKTALTFPATTVSMGGSSQIVTVFNSSSATIAVTPLIVSGDFVVSANGCTGTIAPGGSCTMYARFAPTLGGNRTGTYTVDYSGEAAPLTVALSGTGVAQVILGTTSLAFPATNVAVGSSSQTMDILNRTGLPVTITPTMSDPDFIVSANNCPASLPANSGCTMWVRFTPKAAGALSGALTINANGSSAGTVSLSGTGLAGPITINQTPLTFAPLTVSQGSSSQMVTILNQSGTAITVTPSMSDPDFMVSANNCPASLPNGNGCTIWVRFTPKSAGALNGTLTINAGGTIGTVNLSGTGQ